MAAPRTEREKLPVEVAGSPVASVKLLRYSTIAEPTPPSRNVTAQWSRAIGTGALEVTRERASGLKEHYSNHAEMDACERASVATGCCGTEEQDMAIPEFVCPGVEEALACMIA